MKRILVIGATSAIAKASTRIWAQRGDELFLVARNEERLGALAKDLKIRGAHQTHCYCMDVTQFEQTVPMLDQAFKALKIIDIVLIAYGSLSNQEECEKNTNLMIEEIKVNALSVVALLTHLANRFEKQKKGTIAVISSVAGDRGRASNYVYGSAKALVSTFISGVRQRLFKHGVSIVDIKPGFIDTPMTAHFKKGPLWSTPENIAPKIVLACDSKNSVIYVPFYWMIIIGIIKLVPENFFIKLKL